MKRSIRLSLLVLAASGAMVAAAAGPAVASEEGPSGAPNGEIQQTVHLVGNGHAVRSSAAWVYSGSIHFAVSTTDPQTQNGGGSAVSLFRLKAGKDLDDVTRSLHEEFSQNPSTAAKGTRDILATAIVRGLADVVPGHPETVTEFLSPGTYWLMDLANLPPSGPPQFTRLAVKPAIRHIEQDSDLRSQVTVSTVDEHFQPSTTNWPHAGTYTFTNNADVIHFMQLQPVKPGTTDRDVQRFFDSILSGKNNVPPPFIPGPTGGNDVVSPGFSLQLTYNLPAGRYVLLCFVADEQTGIPHAFMGMHKVIVLH
jgi:hypothetical protein